MIRLLCLWVLSFLFLSCNAGKSNKPIGLKYVYKTHSDCKYPPLSDTIKSAKDMGERMSHYKVVDGYRVYLKYPQVLPEGVTKESIKTYKCQYHFNWIFYHYSDMEQIAILDELLTFKDDTDLAGIYVYKYKDIHIPKPKTITYTMQTDALFLFTRLVMGGYSPDYCPYPVLINTETGEEINNNQEKIKEVFDIYKSWLDGYKKNGAKDLHVPLYGSKYQWYGSTVNLTGDAKHETDFHKITLTGINPFPGLPALDMMYY